MSVEDWSQIAADNSDPTKDAMQEGMDRDQVNNQSRAQQGALRTFFEDAEWLDLLQENNNAFDVLRTGTDNFAVQDDTGTDATSKFPVGMWVKVTGTGTPTVAYGYVSSVGAYGGGQIIVTLAGIVDANYAASDIPSTTVTKVQCYWNHRVRQSAFHPVGTTLLQAPAQIPSIDQLGDGATVDMGTGNGFDADTVDGQHASAFSQAGSINDNALANAGMQIWQRGTSFTTPADATYQADRWCLLAEANQWDVEREDFDTPDGYRYGLRLTASGTTTDQAGILQILSEEDSREIIDTGIASMTYHVLAHTAFGISSIRAGILEWTGGGAPTRDVVQTWHGGGVNPSLAAGWAYANTPVDDAHAADDAWTAVTIENASIDGAATQLAVFIWIDDSSFILGDITRFTGVKLEPSATATAVAIRKFAEEMNLCLPYYQKTYDYGTKPGAISFNGVLEHPSSRGASFGANDAAFDWRFHMPMNAVPTVTTYSPGSGNSGNAWDGDDRACSATDPGTSGTGLLVTANVADGNRISVHATAEAEF